MAYPAAAAVRTVWTDWGDHLGSAPATLDSPVASGLRGHQSLLSHPETKTPRARFFSGKSTSFSCLPRTVLSLSAARGQETRGFHEVTAVRTGASPCPCLSPLELALPWEQEAQGPSWSRLAGGGGCLNHLQVPYIPGIWFICLSRSCFFFIWFSKRLSVTVPQIEESRTV